VSTLQLWFVGSTSQVESYGMMWFLFGPTFEDVSPGVLRNVHSNIVPAGWKDICDLITELPTF